MSIPTLKYISDTSFCEEAQLPCVGGPCHGEFRSHGGETMNVIYCPAELRPRFRYPEDREYTPIPSTYFRAEYERRQFEVRVGTMFLVGFAWVWKSLGEDNVTKNVLSLLISSAMDTT